MHRRRVPTVDSHHSEVLIFDPDPPGEAGAPHFRRRGHVKNKAPDLAQKLSSRIHEAVMRLVELPAIDVNHLQESRRIERPHPGAFPAALRHRVNFEPPSKICLTQKIVIGAWDYAHFRVWFYFLNVRFNDWAVEVERCDLVMLPLDHSIDDLLQLRCRPGNLRDPAFVLCIRGTR